MVKTHHIQSKCFNWYSNQVVILDPIELIQTKATMATVRITFGLKCSAYIKWKIIWSTSLVELWPSLHFYFRFILQFQNWVKITFGLRRRSRRRGSIRKWRQVRPDSWWWGQPRSCGQTRSGGLPHTCPCKWCLLVEQLSRGRPNEELNRFKGSQYSSYFRSLITQITIIFRALQITVYLENNAKYKFTRL